MGLQVTQPGFTGVVSSNITPSAGNSYSLGNLGAGLDWYSIQGRRVAIGDSGGYVLLKAGRNNVVSFTEGSEAAGTTFRAIALSPAEITSNQNDYNPGGSSYFIRLTSDASRNLTGLTQPTAQVDGEVHMIVNVGAQDIVLVNESASSAAANRFTNSTGANITLSAKQAADLVYDGTTSRWLVFKRS